MPAMRLVENATDLTSSINVWFTVVLRLIILLESLNGIQKCLEHIQHMHYYLWFQIVCIILFYHTRVRTDVTLRYVTLVLSVVWATHR